MSYWSYMSNLEIRSIVISVIVVSSGWEWWRHWILCMPSLLVVCLYVCVCVCVWLAAPSALDKVAPVRMLMHVARRSVSCCHLPIVSRCQPVSPTTDMWHHGPPTHAAHSARFILRSVRSVNSSGDSNGSSFAQGGPKKQPYPLREINGMQCYAKKSRLGRRKYQSTTRATNNVVSGKT